MFKFQIITYRLLLYHITNNNTGSTYHNRYRTYYYATYNSNRSSYTYSTYRNSARQQSVNSRTSSGGGTSSGK